MTRSRKGVGSFSCVRAPSAGDLSAPPDQLCRVDLPLLTAKRGSRRALRAIFTMYERGPIIAPLESGRAIN